MASPPAAEHHPDSFDFGLWLDADGVQRLHWSADTGRLQLERAGHQPGRLLATLPVSGHPSPRRADLIVQAVLAGWEARSNQAGSLIWLQERITAIDGATLRPIDWTVACATPGCSANGETVPATDSAWHRRCPHCLAARTVIDRAQTPGQLEAELRTGHWQLAAR